MTRLDLHAPAGRARRHPIQDPTHRREVREMNATRMKMAVHADRAARLAAEAQEVRNARATRRAPRADERRIRRAIGRSLVRIGARIAAEPGAERLQPAGSR